MKKRKEKLEFFTRVLDELFKDYKNKMRLNQNWSIKFKIEEEKDTYAEVVYCYKNREFIVKVNNKMNETILSLKDSIIHEFWHILLSPVMSKIWNTLDKIDDNKKINTKRLRKSFQNEEERLVRKFTRIVRDLDKKQK